MFVTIKRIMMVGMVFWLAIATASAALQLIKKVDELNAKHTVQLSHTAMTEK